MTTTARFAGPKPAEEASNTDASERDQSPLASAGTASDAIVAQATWLLDYARNALQAVERIVSALPTALQSSHAERLTTMRAEVARAEERLAALQQPRVPQ